ncbi:GTP-binding protein [Perilla frutescens var. hirtella]|nr:GTP-binding protein [Perilla frutescens var. frutescens]KAH6792590.1 GTP-binding protein [Perilla frutescens var. hirtella]
MINHCVIPEAQALRLDTGVNHTDYDIFYYKVYNEFSHSCHVLALILYILEEFQVDNDYRDCYEPKSKAKVITRESINFTKIPIEKLPTVMIIGRPNVGNSALFNRLIRMRETLVYNTPNNHVTCDIRDRISKLGDLQLRVLDSVGLEVEASSGSVLGRAAAMTGYVLAKAHCALFIIDKVAKKDVPSMKTIVVMQKVKLHDNITGSLVSAIGESYKLGLGDPITLSVESEFGLVKLCEALRPPLEDYVLQNIKCKFSRF